MKVVLISADRMEKQILTWEGRVLTQQYVAAGDEYDPEQSEHASEEACERAAQQRIAELESWGYSRKAEGEASRRKGKGLSAAAIKSIADAVGVRASKRYKQFLSKAEAKKYAGLAASGLPGWEADGLLEVRFVDDPLELLEERDIPTSRWPGHVPLARLVDETDFLMIKIDEEDCPVLLWNHESGELVRYKASLDAFLATLRPAPEA